MLNPDHKKHFELEFTKTATKLPLLKDFQREISNQCLLSKVLQLCASIKDNFVFVLNQSRLIKLLPRDTFAKERHSCASFEKLEGKCSKCAPSSYVSAQTNSQQLQDMLALLCICRGLCLYSLINFRERKTISKFSTKCVQSFYQEEPLLYLFKIQQYIL